MKICIILFIFKMTLEASLLLGKLYYYEGSYQSALNVFENAHLENISIATSSARLVHIIAESYAVKGKRGYISSFMTITAYSKWVFSVCYCTQRNFGSYHTDQPLLVVFITKTCPCNIQRFFSAVKLENFMRKNVIFLIFLLKT